MQQFFDTAYEKFFFRDIIMTIGSGAALVGQVLMYALIARYSAVLSGNEFLSLHYKIFMGADYVGRWQYIFLLPFSGFVCIAVNYVFSRMLFYSYRSTAQILMVCAALFQYLLLFAVYLLIQINMF